MAKQGMAIAWRVRVILRHYGTGMPDNTLRVRCERITQQQWWSDPRNCKMVARGTSPLRLLGGTEN